MYKQCATEYYKSACESTANVYYEAVRALGKKRDVEILAARMEAEAQR
jgi:hypothetical protein